ncbi:MAG: DUF2194 domain-containing protein [Ruminococcus sp.]|jgi:hypothetical protein|nr:DUF2194 domain-containing protein [Ruminococcus sp.]
MSKRFERLFFILMPLFAFIILTAVIIYQRIGVSEFKTAGSQIDYIEAGAVLSEITDSDDECLFIYNSTEDPALYNNLTFTLNEMCVDFSEFDVAGGTELPDLNGFESAVVALFEGDTFSTYIDTAMDWVKSGGNLLFAGVPGFAITDIYPEEFGLQITEWSYIDQKYVSISDDFFAGADGKVFDLDEEGYPMSGGNFLLKPDTDIFMSSESEQGSTPMVWSNNTGEGRITVINYAAIANTGARGIFAQSYAHTVPVAVWPVINASSFFIDDFPAPVPTGTNEYIDRDYGVTVDYFYTNIWWPNIKEIGEKYDLRYTGMFIETYEDNVNTPFVRPADLERQKYFGRLLLADGEEIALHGYNHQSLTYTGFEYKNGENYISWDSPEDISAALSETQSAMANLFNDYVPEVYVPPSNVWLPETREVIASNFPNIKVFSGLYDDTIYGQSQEFETDDDGLINFPRIVSNCIINDYDIMLMLSEINFHYVNSHFMHPDDALDPDRSAEQGWEAMRDSYESLVSMVSDTGIRQLTASESAAAVERFDRLDVEFTYTDKDIYINLGGFYDEAYLLVRTGDKVPGNVSGGEITNIQGSLYLLKATSPNVRIVLQ